MLPLPRCFALVVLVAAAAAGCGAFGTSSSPEVVPDASSDGSAGGDAGALAPDAGAVDAAAAADAAADAAPSLDCAHAPSGAFCEDFEAPLSAIKWRLTQCVDAYHCSMVIAPPDDTAPSHHLVMTATDVPAAEIDALVPLPAGVTVARYSFRMNVLSGPVSMIVASLQIVGPGGVKAYLNLNADAYLWRATWHGDNLIELGQTIFRTMGSGWHDVVVLVTLNASATCSPFNASARFTVAGVSETMQICVPFIGTSAVVQVGNIVAVKPMPPAEVAFDDVLFVSN